ncbi:hypothetical protein ACFQZ8_17800, partial [Micromonospora azadirachtae]
MRQEDPPRQALLTRPDQDEYARPPAQRTRETAPDVGGAGDRVGQPGLDVTTVLPYAGSRASRRTRWLRAWM